LKRHSLNKKKKRAWNMKKPNQDWPLDMSDLIGILVVDEAHLFKAAEKGVRWTAIKLVKAQYTNALTRTPLDNKVDDIAAQ
jgi:beta-galactosidase/beta-glucuronidase